MSNIKEEKPSPDLQGLVSELQLQRNMLGDRAADLAAGLSTARAELESSKARERALKKELEECQSQLDLLKPIPMAD